jgi:osmotically-inducible protein OsmY
VIDGQEAVEMERGLHYLAASLDGAMASAARTGEKELDMFEHVLQRIGATVAVVGLLAASSLPSSAQTPADNTKVNTRDRAKGAATADQQKDNAADRTLTQKIRQALMQDKSLSSYAHNVKVIAQGGNVTLKGPVRSADEKTTVESKAVEVAGTGHVVNEMSIAPIKAKKK